MSFLGDVVGAVAGGALAYFTGGASLAVGAALGGAVGGAATGGGVKGAIGGAALGYTGGSLMSAYGAGAVGADAGATGGAVGAGSVADLLGSPSMGALDIGGVSLGGGAVAGSGAGALPWGSAGSLMSTGTSLYGLYESQKLQEMAKQLQASADPFAAYRSQYAQQMSALAADPSLITKQPGYAAGIQAVQRTGAAQGYTGSGNMAAALQKYAGDFYNSTMSMYGGFAGANANPASAASIGLQGQGLGANLALNSLGLLTKTGTMATSAGLPPGYNPANPAGTQ